MAAAGPPSADAPPPERGPLVRAVLGPLRWLEDRTGLGAFIAPIMTHKVPPSAKWFYVFGSATLMFFSLQIVTGICLATLYAPSASNAYQNLVYIDTQVPFGWMLRALHGWSSNAMVAMMILHMVQVFLHATYKFPRELTWMVGVLLCLLTLALAFTGQVLRWDQDAYWGIGIGAAIADRIPFVGDWARGLLLGGPIISGETLSRFFALHVFVLPGITIALVGLHLVLVLRHGISEMPKVGEPVDPATYREAYEKRIAKEGVPFWPDAAKRDMVFCGLALLALVAVALVAGPMGPKGIPDPTDIETNPRPDLPFLWIFGLVSLIPPASETAVMLIAPGVLIVGLILLPLFGNAGERAPSRRPFMVLGVVLSATVLGILTWEGAKSPWSPVMDAWSSIPTPVEYVEDRGPLELQGAVVVQNAQCRNCHELGGRGGKRGPALDDVATRLSYDQLIRQVQQGGGNMPAFGKNLTSAETEAVVRFLLTMHPANEQTSSPPGALLPIPRQAAEGD
jgi:ubiquinol-cytochrome c reductase cytochrome b subunit